jgi:hypothetical protein
VSDTPGRPAVHPAVHPAIEVPAECYDHQDGANRCYLCGEPDYEPVHEVEHFGFPFRFQRCRCGLEKQTPMPEKPRHLPAALRGAPSLAPPADASP